MKAKEAPEKLYITYKGYGVFDEDSTVERTKDSQTEYTRTDAVIERVIRWIDYNNRNGGCNFDGWEKDIKNYMKGE
jgi:hypothetical protein